MREVTNKVYRFGELDEQAQERALGEIRRILEQGWDSGDNEDVQDTIVYTLAEKLKTAGWDTFGPGDFPGVDGVTVDGWDADRQQALAVSGVLTRENAPALPWIDEIDHVTLKGSRSDATSVDLVEAEGECTCERTGLFGAHVSPCPVILVLVRPYQRSVLEQAVRDALSEAWTAGEKEAEYKTSAEYARELATDQDQYEFNVDGTLWHN